MSREDGVFIVSRLAALYLLIWALIEITEIPALMRTFINAMKHQGTSDSGPYWFHYHQVLGVSLSARILVLAVSSAVFWKCGPIVQRLFSQPQPDLTSGECAE